MKTLHTYGDSHASRYGGWDRIKINDYSININHLGGKLLYSFGRDKNLIVKNINEGDGICFCFGEIDCRCHVNKYEPNWKKCIDDMVEQYFISIYLNVRNYPNITVFVYNVVPPLQRELPKNKHTEIGNLLPSLGTDLDRQKYTLYMNSKISEFCRNYNYVFLDVYDKYVNSNGFLSEEYSDGNCHIKNPIFIQNFLIKHLI